MALTLPIDELNGRVLAMEAELADFRGLVATVTDRGVEVTGP
jgi:hypothetical protein